MALSSLNILKKGLEKLENAVKDRKHIREVLQAAATLNRYIDELDDPIAWKLETNLGSFKYQLCLNQAKSMKSTILTDFFSHRVWPFLLLIIYMYAYLCNKLSF